VFAVCCSLLQCVAVCCSEGAPEIEMARCEEPGGDSAGIHTLVAVSSMSARNVTPPACCSVVQYVAVGCSVLQCDAVWCRVV